MAIKYNFINLLFLFVLFANFCEIDAKKNYDLNDNFHLLRFDINEYSISDAITGMNDIKDSEVILYLDSNGGDVISGNILTEYMETLKQNKTVTCIAENAFSMAFVIFQHCSNRYILDSSILMQHQMHFEIRGDLKNVENYVKMMTEMNNQINKFQADRIGISLEKFNELTMNDWWMYGDSAIKNRAADGIVTISCNQNIFNEKIKKKFMTLFGINELSFSKCPFIKTPLS